MKHLQGSSCFAPLKSRRWTAERYPLSPPGDPGDPGDPCDPASTPTQFPETAHNRFLSPPLLGPVASWKRHPAGSAPSGMFQSPFAPDRVAAFRETAQRNCAPKPRNTGCFFDRTQIPQHPDISVRPSRVRVQWCHRPSPFLTHIKAPSKFVIRQISYATVVFATNILKEKK